VRIITLAVTFSNMINLSELLLLLVPGSSDQNS